MKNEDLYSQTPSLDKLREKLTQFFNQNPDKTKDDPNDAGVAMLRSMHEKLNGECKMDVKERIKSGYFYRLGGENSKMVAMTGYQGALNYVDTCREMGLSDCMIAEDLYITESEGMVAGMSWVPLSIIEWKKK